MKEKIKLKFEKFNIKTLLLELLVIIVGTFIASLGFSVFLEPHNISPGGFMGLAKIIYDLFAKINFTAISVSLWYIILNIFLFIYAVYSLGWKFGVRAGVGLFSYSLFVELIGKTGIVDYVTSQFKDNEAASYILFAIYGGVIMGAGLGLVFRANGSTGGCDMLAIVINKFFPSITTGQIIMAVDGAVVLLSAIAYQSLVLPLYALITIFISSKVLDLFVDGVKSFRAYYIITSKKEEISKIVFKKLNRGVTDIYCEGVYTHQKRDMLMVIVRRSQVMTLKKIVREIDPASFMFSNNVKEAYGNGFIGYSKNKKVKKSTSKNEVNDEKIDLVNIEESPKQQIQVEDSIKQSEITIVDEQK